MAVQLKTTHQELGSGSFIPGFEDQLIGHNADEDVDVNVTFPEDYHAKNLAGKDALFKVKIHEIKESNYQNLTMISLRMLTKMLIL